MSTAVILEIRPDLIEHVVRPIPAEGLADASTSRHHLFVNPTGRFVIGGPHGRLRLTGRKIIVDTYGGGPPRRRRLLGQGPDKVDRSAAYVARSWPRTRRRRSGRACEVQLAYAIGVAEPVSRAGRSYGTGRRSREERSSASVREIFDLRPGRSSETLDLRRPIYAKRPPTATSAATSPTSPGSAPTRPTTIAPPPVSPRSHPRRAPPGTPVRGRGCPLRDAPTPW